MKLSEIQKQIAEINTSKGRRDDANNRTINDIEYVITKLALIHSEVSEAVEAVLNEDEFNFADELADVFIRTFDLADILNIEIDKAILDKIKYSYSRVSLMSLQSIIAEYFTKKDLRKNVKIKRKLSENMDFIFIRSALIHRQISRAVESVRVANTLQFIDALACVIIETIELADLFEYNFDSLVTAKLVHNSSRSKKHGGKKV